MALTEKEAPFTEPYALAGNPKGFKAKGPTAEAVKRALAHLGFMPWKEDGWDQHWNEAVNDAAQKWKKKRGIGTDGSWGREAHDVMQTAWYEKGGEKLPAFDGRSQSLLQGEYEASQEVVVSGNADEKVRKAIVEFCEAAMGSSKWTYSQNRAVDISVDPKGYVTSDCSGSCIQAFNYARQKTGIAVPDPSKQGWSGYGNTSYFLDDWGTVSGGQYLVGDLAHYDGHVCCCIKAGNSDTADWWSFGSEPPSRRKLYYRDDFRKVVRPPLT